MDRTASARIPCNSSRDLHQRRPVASRDRCRGRIGAVMKNRLILVAVLFAGALLTTAAAVSARTLSKQVLQ